MSKRSAFIIKGLPLLFVLLILSGSLYADTIYLKNGNIAEGEIMKDTNGVAIIDLECDLRFRVKTQKKDTKKPDFRITDGRFEVDNWDVDHSEAIAWNGENIRVNLIGWIGDDTKWLKAAYYYLDLPDREDAAHFDPFEDNTNDVKGTFIWEFTNLSIQEDLWISGEFKVLGTIKENGRNVPYTLIGGNSFISKKSSRFHITLS